MKTLNHLLLTACRADQTAADANIDGKPCGAFSYYLNRALRNGGANMNRQALIDKVAAALQDGHFSQVPQMEGASEDGPLFAPNDAAGDPEPAPSKPTGIAARTVPQRCPRRSWSLSRSSRRSTRSHASEFSTSTKKDTLQRDPLAAPSPNETWSRSGFSSRFMAFASIRRVTLMSGGIHCIRSQKNLVMVAWETLAVKFSGVIWSMRVVSWRPDEGSTTSDRAWPSRSARRCKTELIARRSSRCRAAARTKCPGDWKTPERYQYSGHQLCR